MSASRRVAGSNRAEARAKLAVQNAPRFAALQRNRNATGPGVIHEAQQRKIEQENHALGCRSKADE